LRQLAARPPAEPIRKGVICAAKLKLITSRLSPLVRAAANQFPIAPRASGALGVSLFISTRLRCFVFKVYKIGSVNRGLREINCCQANNFNIAN
jgi:hypothetical protein